MGQNDHGKIVPWLINSEPFNQSISSNSYVPDSTAIDLVLALGPVPKMVFIYRINFHF